MSGISNKLKIVVILMFAAVMWRGLAHHEAFSLPREPEKYTKSRGLSDFFKKFRLKLNPDLPKPEMNAEPIFTGGNSNCVFWKPDTTGRVTHYGVVCASDSSFDSLLVRAPTTFACFYELQHGKQYWYKVVSIDSASQEISPPSDSVFSTQDTICPRIDSVMIMKANRLGWSKSCTLQISFLATDSAGIDSVCLYSRKCGDTWHSVPDTCEGYWQCTTGNPGPTTVIDTFTFIAPHDGCYEFYVGAKDAAHAPESHEDYWICDGNEMIPDDTVMHARVKVDTYLPTSTVICDILEDTTYVDSFPVWFTANDTAWPAFLSGLETIWLYAAYDTNEFAPVCTTSNFPDSSAVDTLCIFNADSGDGWYYFYTIARDKAGNIQGDTIQCSTYVFTELEVDFVMHDRIDTLDTIYTNDDTVGAKVTLISGTAKHPYDVYFVQNSETTFVWDSVYFDSVTRTIDSVIVLSKQDGEKIVKCCIRYHLITDSESPWCSDTITLDRRPCEIVSFVLSDLDDTYPRWTNSDTVWVTQTVSCSLAGPERIILWGDVEPDTTDTTYQDSVKIGLSNGDGLKIVNCTVIDSAGNRSDSVKSSIMLDRTRPTLDSVILSDISIPGPSDSDMTDSSLVEVTLVLRDSLSGKLCHIILAQSSGLVDSNRKVYLYPDSVSSVIGDTATIYYPSDSTYYADSCNVKGYWGRILEVYCAITDSAGNSSDRLCDSICVIHGPLVCKLDLYDRVDITDSICTNDSIVRAVVTLVSGSVDDPYDLYFMCDSDTFEVWKSNHFDPDTGRIDSLIVLCNPEQDGPKLVKCCVKNLTTSDSCICSHTITLDREKPSIDSLSLVALLTTEEDSCNGSYPGWTDSVLVRVLPHGVRDSICGCEFLIFWGNLADTLDTALSCGDTLLELSMGDGPKTVWCTVVDYAGNVSSDTIKGDIVLDTKICSIYIDVDSIVYDTLVEVRFDSLCLDTTDLVKAKLWEKWNDWVSDTTCHKYTRIDTFIITPDTGWHHIYATVRDSAGNWTPEVYDSTFYVQRCTLFSITLIDTFPLQEPGMAKTGWTNDTLVWLLPEYDECPLADSIAVVDCNCLDSTCNDTVKHGLRDTILIHLKPTFKRHCIKAWLTYADTVSNSVSDTIVYDSMPPELRLMDVKEDQLTEGKEWILDDPNIEVDIEAFDDKCLYSYDFIQNGSSRWTQADTFDNCPVSFIGSLRHTLRSEEGKIELLLVIYDAAGNSDTLGDTIYYDVLEPIVAFPNPFNPAQDEHATIRLKDPAKEVRIYDPFGNFVCKLRKDQNSHDFIWDGRNGRGRIVANGGYLAVVPGKRPLCKIAVLKK